jgi:hypothetical protein
MNIELTNEENIAILEHNIEKTIETLLTDKKLKYISNTMEFVNGLMIGLEIAGIYGDEIHKLYINNIDKS